MHASSLSEQTKTVYKAVIHSVIEEMRGDLLNEGLPQSLVDQIKGVWDFKITQRGVYGGPGSSVVHK
jgi:hypothetical protein